MVGQGLLHDRDFRLVAGSVGLSAVGDWVAIVALGARYIGFGAGPVMGGFLFSVGGLELGDARRRGDLRDGCRRGGCPSRAPLSRCLGSGGGGVAGAGRGRAPAPWPGPGSPQTGGGFSLVEHPIPP